MSNAEILEVDLGADANGESRRAAVPVRRFAWLERLSETERERYEVVGDEVRWEASGDHVPVSVLLHLSCD